MNIERIRKMPKAELHCHLDGSISLETLRKLAGTEIQEETVKAPVPCGSLSRYLQCFSAVLPLLQTEKALELAAYDVVRQAFCEHVIYMEIRFAPAFHCTRGLDQQQVCRAVLRGMERGQKDFGVLSCLLLCLMRGNGEEENLTTLECARALQGYGVGGLDLAGDEAGYPTRLYRQVFSQAARYGIPFTLHSGECGSAENVRHAVEMGARRVGHGVAAADQPQLLQLCREKKICFEMCPVSNLQTRAVENLQSYPFLPMLKSGMSVTVNTDNRTVSDTTLTGEWMTLIRQFPEIDEQVILQANLHAVEAAFLPQEDRREIQKQLKRG